MTVKEFAARYPAEFTAERLACCEYLERQGQRFMIDFGYENAPPLVWQELDAAYYTLYPESEELCLGPD